MHCGCVFVLMPLTNSRGRDEGSGGGCGKMVITASPPQLTLLYPPLPCLH